MLLLIVGKSEFYEAQYQKKVVIGGCTRPGLSERQAQRYRPIARDGRTNGERDFLKRSSVRNPLLVLRHSQSQWA